MTDDWILFQHLQNIKSCKEIGDIDFWQKRISMQWWNVIETIQMDVNYFIESKIFPQIKLKKIQKKRELFQPKIGHTKY